MLKIRDIAFAIVSFVVFASASHAEAGRETGNGGDSIALEFTTTARAVLEDIKTDPKLFPEVTDATFERAIDETEVVTTDQAILNHVEKDAVNYPELRMIKVNRNRWLQVDDNKRKKALVFHEYLGIMRINDSNYIISGRLFTNSRNGKFNLTLLADGNYRSVTGETSCDYHIESNPVAAKVFVTFISNQRTGEDCSYDKTEVFRCGDEGICSYLQDNEETANPAKIQIINGKAFLDWNDKKYVYSNNDPIQPAKKFVRSASYGFYDVGGHSFTGQSRCAIFASEGYYWCDDAQIAETNFCPKARKIAEDTALADCESETGVSCKIVNHGRNSIVSNHYDGSYDSSSLTYIFSNINLFCNVDGVAAVSENSHR